MRENQFVPLQKTIFLEWDSICTWALQKIRYGERTIDHFPETDGQILRLATAGAALHLCLNGFSRLRQHRERLCCHETWTKKLLGLRYDDFTGNATHIDMENERCPILATAQNFGMARYYLNSFKWSSHCRSIDATCSSHTRQSWKTLAWFVY